MYVKVHDLHKEGFSVSAITRKVGLSRNTVYKYLGCLLKRQMNG
ncbi:helix-turn-helix domain-containing protein [Domibacillus iocasae]